MKEEKKEIAKIATSFFLSEKRYFPPCSGTTPTLASRYTAGLPTELPLTSGTGIFAYTAGKKPFLFK